jgi:hypothetical protein
LFGVADTLGNSSCIPFIQFSNGDEVDDVSFYREPAGGPVYEVLDTFAVCETPVFPLQTPLAAGVVHTSAGVGNICVGGQSCTQETIDRAASVVGNDVTIGRAPYPQCATFSGNIAKISVYRRALYDVDRTTVERYLKERWAL